VLPVARHMGEEGRKRFARLRARVLTKPACSPDGLAALSA